MNKLNSVRKKFDHVMKSYFIAESISNNFTEEERKILSNIIDQGFAAFELARDLKSHLPLIAVYDQLDTFILDLKTKEKKDKKKKRVEKFMKKFIIF